MIGQLLGGHYRIIRELSSGGFGITYLAEDTQLIASRLCVVKKLRPPSNDLKTIQWARKLFKQEAETLEKLGHHDQIPRLLAYFEENEEFYLVQEFIPGQTLAQELEQKGLFNANQVIFILIEVLKILEFVHKQGVIHRDIKPANLIRRDGDGKIVLIDFGSVKRVVTEIFNSQGQPTSTVIVGTPNYMPYEQFSGNPRPNSDIYALGVFAIQALTGLLAEDISRLRDPNQPGIGEIRWRHRSQHTSDSLANIIDRMVCHDCYQRYESAAEVLSGLTNLVNSPANSQQHTIPMPPPPLKRRRRIWIITIAGVATLSVVGGLIWWKFFSQPKNQQCLTYNDGVEAIKSQEFKKAIYYLDLCIQNNPKDGISYLRRGYAYYRQNDYNKAIDDDNQALKIFEQQENRISTGILVKKQDDILKVDRVFPETPAFIVGLRVDDQILEIDGQSTKNLSQQEASNLINQGQANTLVTLKVYRQGGPQSLSLNRVKVNDNIRAKVYVNRGLAQLGQGNKKAAIDDYNQALSLTPNYAEAYYERASIRSEQADKQEAFGDYTKAIQLQPKYIDAYIGRGELRSLQGDKTGAIADYTQAIDIDADSTQIYGPNYVNQLHSQAYNSRGYVKYQLGDMQEAISDYTQAIQLNQEYGSAYYNRAMVRSNMADKQGAMNDLQTAADLYLKHGDTKRYDQARTQLVKLQQPSPTPTTPSGGKTP